MADFKAKREAVAKRTKELTATVAVKDAVLKVEERAVEDKWEAAQLASANLADRREEVEKERGQLKRLREFEELDAHASALKRLRTLADEESAVEAEGESLRHALKKADEKLGKVRSDSAMCEENLKTYRKEANIGDTLPLEKELKLVERRAKNRLCALASDGQLKGESVQGAESQRAGDSRRASGERGGALGNIQGGPGPHLELHGQMGQSAFTARADTHGRGFGGALSTSDFRGVSNFGSRFVGVANESGLGSGGRVGAPGKDQGGPEPDGQLGHSGITGAETHTDIRGAFSRSNFGGVSNFESVFVGGENQSGLGSGGRVGAPGNDQGGPGPALEVNGQVGQSGTTEGANTPSAVQGRAFSGGVEAPVGVPVGDKEQQGGVRRRLRSLESPRKQNGPSIDAKLFVGRIIPVSCSNDECHDEMGSFYFEKNRKAFVVCGCGPCVGTATCVCITCWLLKRRLFPDGKEGERACYLQIHCVE